MDTEIVRIQSEALINLPNRKEIVSKQELLEEIKRVVAKMPKAQGQMQVVTASKKNARVHLPSLATEGGQNLVLSILRLVSSKATVLRVTNWKFLATLFYYRSRSNNPVPLPSLHKAKKTQLNI